VARKFARGTVPDEARFHSWPGPARLTRDIRERDKSFVYIDGAFRPDAQQVLRLLSGTALYGAPLIAVRELLQNAVDAVREQIAYERLGQDNPGDRSLADQLGSLHKVTLTFAPDVDGYWLTCTDDGVGMTKEIVERHLLVSGSSGRPWRFLLWR
jgi:HSP90 family molecular chaperone